MPNPTTFGLILIAVAAVAFGLRVAAIWRPSLRLWANVSALLVALVIAGLIGYVIVTLSAALPG